MSLLLYTDGGCTRGRIGAWAFVLLDGTKVVASQSGALRDTTNNRMEIMGVLQGLEAAPGTDPIEVVSDSKYVIDASTQWVWWWLKSGWRTSENRPVKNRDLWERVIPLLRAREVTFRHVRGHTGVAYNEMCDTLCTKAIRQAQFGPPVPIDVGAIHGA